MVLAFTSRKPLSPSEPYLPGSYLFITAGTFQKRPFLASDHCKGILLESLDFNAYKWGWRLLAYALLDNHYHLVMQTPPADPSRLAHIVQSAHSFSAYHFRREDPSIRGRIWWNFWDTPIDSRDSVWAHIHYVHQNPRLHGIADAPEQYAFSSYAAYLAIDSEGIRQQERQFPGSRLAIQDDF